MNQLTLSWQPGPWDSREERPNAVLRCVAIGKRLRVMCISQCANPQWFCAFPNHLRLAGQHYQVGLLVAARRHYRALPPIKAIAPPADAIALGAS